MGLHKRFFFCCMLLAVAGLGCKSSATPPATAKTEKITTPPIQMAQMKNQSPAPSNQLPEKPAPEQQPSDVAVPSDQRLPAGSVEGPATSDRSAQTPVPIPFTPKPVKSLTQINIVLDGSGSMSGPMESDTKMAYVQSVVRDLLTQPAPAESKRHIGLRVFGAQHPVEANRCEDSQQLAPVGPLEAAKLGALVQRVAPRGTAPLAYALQQAENDFAEQAEADNLLLLIADGADTCGGDPCAAAERLHAGPRHVIIHVIGFDLDQKAQDQLRCVAEKGDGHFYLARNVAELRSAVDQAANANLPYNLRLKVLVGATPLPTQISVSRSGADQVMEKGMSPGMKFFQLAPGTYDVTIEYIDSVEQTKPSKILKGVEIQTTSRAEQIVQFDLGQLTISSTDPQGQLARATYTLRRSGATDVVGTFESGPDAKTIALSPGTYDLTVSGLAAGTIPLSTTASGLEIRNGETREQAFRFETGTLFLRAQSGPEQFVKAAYTVTAPDKGDVAFTEGALSADGSTVTLPAGTYDLTITASDPSLQGLAAVELQGIAVQPRATATHVITFPRGTFLLSGTDIGKDGKGTVARTEFQVRRAGSTDIVVKAIAETGPVSVAVAPGTYDILALNIGANVTPAPSILWKDLTAQENAQAVHEAAFQLGELKLISRNARGGPMPGIFTVFRAGEEELLGTVRGESDWVTFRLTPGLYDVRAEDGTAKGDPKPHLWFREVAVVGNTGVTREATFTAGKLKLGCRGENNIVLPCEFRIFTYGMDRPLFNGTTGEQWKEFEIDPGKYYMEAGYHDPQGEQFLKKWINITIAENQVVEQIIRF